MHGISVNCVQSLFGREDVKVGKDALDYWTDARTPSNFSVKAGMTLDAEVVGQLEN